MTNGHQLRLYNSLGRRVEDFVPSGDVTGMYSCGPTVYAYQHLGNMRAYVSADTVRRALRWKGVRVRHVVNITDVGHAVSDADTGEDKMEVAAAMCVVLGFQVGALVLGAGEAPRPVRIKGS